MRLTRFAPLALALVLAGCASAPEGDYSTRPAPAAGPEIDAASTSELLEQRMKSVELSVGRHKDAAKTVGYGPGSTEEGERFFDGAVIVDRVTRQDADNLFGVTLALFNNREDAPVTIEWRIAFFNDQGAEMTSLRPGWKSCQLDFKRWGTVSNFATARGATRFKLEVRAPGTGGAP